jgi:hypothetical protein
MAASWSRRSPAVISPGTSSPAATGSSRGGAPPAGWGRGSGCSRRRRGWSRRGWGCIGSRRWWSRRRAVGPPATKSRCATPAAALARRTSPTIARSGSRAPRSGRAGRGGEARPAHDPAGGGRAARGSRRRRGPRRGAAPDRFRSGPLPRRVVRFRHPGGGRGAGEGRGRTRCLQSEPLARAFRRRRGARFRGGGAARGLRGLHRRRRASRSVSLRRPVDGAPRRASSGTRAHSPAPR